MHISRKSVWISAFAVILFFAGSYFYVWWSLRHMKIELPLDALFQRVFPQAEVIGAALRASGNCPAAVDSSSIGNREKEAEMYFVATMPSLYKEKFGHAPSYMSDLQKLPEFDRPDSLNDHVFMRDCSIYVDAGGSFAVSCGRLKPSSSEVGAFMRKAEPIQKFNMLGKSEILYVPAPTC
jgi:hypothetical protein